VDFLVARDDPRSCRFADEEAPDTEDRQWAKAGLFRAAMQLADAPDEDDDENGEQ